MGTKKNRLKRWLIILAGIIVLLCILGTLVFAYLPSILFRSKWTPIPDLTLLNTEAWDKAVYSFVPPPTEDGNAMAYFLEAIHFGFYEPSAGGLKSKFSYSWWENFETQGADVKDRKTGGIITEAIKIPELDILVKGSHQKGYQWVGIFYTPSANAQISYLPMKTPEYLDMHKLTRILMARAIYKLEHEDKTGAEEDMLAALRIGHLMQKDVDMIGFIMGYKIESFVANKMPEFYRKVGNEDKAKKWEELLPIIKKRNDAAGAFINYELFGDVGQLMKFVDDRTLPRSVRLSSLVFIPMSYYFWRPITTITGLPKDAKRFIKNDHFDDPEMVILQLKFIEDTFEGPSSGIKESIKILFK